MNNNHMVHHYGSMKCGHILGFGKIASRGTTWDRYWRTNYHNPLLIGEECVCKTYEIIARCITESDEETGVKVFNLRPYKYAGHPYWAWQFRDVGVAHWNDPTKHCSGVIYGYGRIGPDGELLCLPDEFKTGYDYPGYMMLIQAPYDCTIDRFVLDCDSYRPSSLTPCKTWK